MCQDELPPGLPGIKRKQPQKLTVSKITKTITENSHIQHCKQSYIYNFSGQKLIKIGKNNPFWRVFENLKLTVRQVTFKTTKIEKFKCDIFSDFQTLWVGLRAKVMVGSGILILR